MKKALFVVVPVMALVLLLNVPQSPACSRATWFGKDGSVISGRSMDWPYDFNTHFYIIPCGEKNEGSRAA